PWVAHRSVGRPAAAAEWPLQESARRRSRAAGARWRRIGPFGGGRCSRGDSGNAERWCDVKWQARRQGQEPQEHSGQWRGIWEIPLLSACFGRPIFSAITPKNPLIRQFGAPTIRGPRRGELIPLDLQRSFGAVQRSDTPTP